MPRIVGAWTLDLAEASLERIHPYSPLWRAGQKPFGPRRSSVICNSPEAMPGRLDEVSRILRESGYAGETVVIISPSDFPTINAMSLVTADLLRRLGMRVEMVATDWSGVLALCSSPSAHPNPPIPPPTIRNGGEAAMEARTTRRARPTRCLVPG